MDCLFFSYIRWSESYGRCMMQTWVTALKELYTSETTLAQKIVLTPLNNEFRLKI